ncbi:MAG: flagellar hook capping FlgD N-terminal domain-containing protein [Roseobacter sp.]
MEITNSNPVTSPTLSPSATATGDDSQAAAVLSSDFETFLQMLTAQAKYQDPLEPIDSSEYAAQLAQFSMVEQQVLSNDLLTALADQLGAGNIAQMSGWIGLEARTQAPVPYSGEAVTVLPQSEAGADEAILVVTNASGTEVARRQIPLGSEPVEWDGRNSAGAFVQPANYSFSVESRTAGTVIGNSPADTYTRITEARREGSDAVFVLAGGSQVRTNEVAALREPQ